MVLLPKQVHLQKDVGAGDCQHGIGEEKMRQDLHAARDSDRKAKKVKTARKYLLMVAVAIAQSCSRATGRWQGPLGLRCRSSRCLQDHDSPP
jgi:hypothetical protein